MCKLLLMVHVWSLGKALRVKRTGEVTMQTLVELEGLRVNNFNSPL